MLFLCFSFAFAKAKGKGKRQRQKAKEKVNIVKLSQGSTLTKDIPLRFYKTLNNLSITIDSSHVSISRSLDKPLFNNKYIPLHLDEVPNINNSFFNYLKRKILTIIKKLIY